MKMRIILIYGACLLLTVTFFPKTAKAMPFTLGTAYATGNAPWEVVTGDWNKDGKLDVAVSNEGGDSITAFLNDGNGGMTAQYTGATCSQPFGLVAGDFNNDSWTDLAASCDGVDRVTVFINRANGTGDFLAGVESAAGNQPRGLAAYDFDRDGNLDLASADFGGGMSVMIGNGDGTFVAPVSYAGGLYTTDITIGDFNGDSKEDVVVTNSCAGCFVPYNTGSVSFFSGNGDGTFAASVNTATARGSVAIVSGDWNGDGVKDIAVAKPRHNLMSVLTGNGDGTFTLMPDYAAGLNPQGIAAGDVNQDGVSDILLANSTDNTFSVYTGVAGGTFNAYVTTTAGTTPLGMALGDFNRDGKLDLALGNEADNTLAIYFDANPPAITSLSPNSASVGDSGLTITVTGSGFAPNTKGKVNGFERPTTVNSPTSMTVGIGPTDLSSAGTINFTAYNPSLNLTSNQSPFTVSGQSSNGGGGLPPETFLPPAEPAGGFAVLLDNGATQTASRTVKITFKTDVGTRVPAAKKFAVSNSADFKGASILPLTASLDWDLCHVPGSVIADANCVLGKHTVYVKFFTDWGQASPAIQTNIDFQPVTLSSTLALGQTITHPNFTRTLKRGMSGADVRMLQQTLNAQGFEVSASGAGSPGMETTLFGQATENALKRFQAAHSDKILKPLGLTLPTGVFGPATRDLINSI